MDIPENNHKKITLAIIFIVIVALVLFAIVWKTKTKKATQIQTQTTGVTTPDGTTIPTPPEMPKIPVPAEVTSISGTIEKIEGKTLTVKAFFFGEEKTYTVTVGDATKIQKSEMKKEVSAPEEGKPFEPFNITDASSSDIRQNDSLTIEASENIKDKTSFVAKTITVNITNLPEASIPPDASTPSNISAPPAMPNLPAPPKMPDFPAPPTINQ